MLREIQSNAFKSHGKIRPKVVFNDGLNVLKGPDSSDNSIGKSNFLMALDFVFGGEDYVKKLDEVDRHVGKHEINFAFEFDGKIRYFSRSTANPEIISICDKDYQKTGDQMTLANYTQWLKEQYLIKNKLTWRDIVGRYIRVYRRENGTESLPLRVANNEPSSTAIEKLLKLFDLHDAIRKFIDDSNEANDKKSAFNKAQNYQYIPRINKTKYNENIKRIKELENQKLEMADKAGKNLLELDSEKAAAISQLKQELRNFKRQRAKYYNQLDAIKRNKEIETPSIQSDFAALKEFFPELDESRLELVESFHKELTGILKSNFKDAEVKTWNLINLANIQIENIEHQINDIEHASNLSKIVLDEYAKIDKEINDLKNENDKYDKQDELAKDSTEKANLMEEKQMSQEKILQEKLNETMATINSYIFGQIKNSPQIEFTSTKMYNFFTYDDGGTGTNFKGMIIFDLACLKLTEVPFLVHDSFLFKNISRSTIEKIFELYRDAGAQIFVAFDNTSNFTKSTQRIIEDSTVIELSGNGNELYGQKW